jgi:ubiquinone/menaquinone biosynthesis C-methylase UbiE
VAESIRRDHYLPGMGRTWLTPLYDPVTRILGIPALHRLLVDQAGIRARQRVLEIGCGTGNLALLVKRLHAGADVVGVDPDAAALRIARRKAARAGLDIRWDTGFAQALAYPDGSFDRILSALMLHHLAVDDKLAALRTARRTLTRRGSLHLVDFGGRTVASDGFMARRMARNAHVKDNYAGGIITAMHHAGFTRVSEVDHRVSRLMGRITFYRADV